MSLPRVEIGVFGGSGFYDLGGGVDEIKIHTPYGPPSDAVQIAKVAGRSVAFLPRHGKAHTLPPHRINYRANLHAMHQLGVQWLISPCACGSLRAEIAPGHLVVTDQYVDRTNGRADTFFDGPRVAHIPSGEPYCPVLRRLAVETIAAAKIPVHDGGTMVVIQGPRFSTKAESQWFTNQGWHTINMTQYPEVVLAQELGICIVNIALVTDYDAGLAGNVPEVTTAEVLAVFKQNGENLRRILVPLVEKIPTARTCRCQAKAAEAFIS